MCPSIAPYPLFFCLMSHSPYMNVSDLTFSFKNLSVENPKSSSDKFKALYHYMYVAIELYTMYFHTLLSFSPLCALFHLA